MNPRNASPSPALVALVARLNTQPHDVQNRAGSYLAFRCDGPAAHLEGLRFDSHEWENLGTASVFVRRSDGVRVSLIS